jgi:hypothetical protein
MITRREFLRGTAVAGGALVSGALWPRWVNAAGNVAVLGAFAEPTTGQTNLQALTSFEDQIGRAVDVYRTYRNWSNPVFTPTVESLYDPQQNPYAPPIPYISFHAFFKPKGNNCLAWADIANGSYDRTIDSWAAELTRLVGKAGRAYVCFQHEMENEEGTPPDGCGTPEDFKAAYWHFRYRVEIFNAVPDLTWVITYMGNTFQRRPKHGGPERWWPSSSDTSYVDGVPDDHLVGQDVYNRNTCQKTGKWKTFKSIAQPAYDFAGTKGRRFFVGECGCVEGDSCSGTLPHGTAKAQWFQDASTVMSSWPALEAFCYSNVLGFNNSDFHIDTSQASLAAFRSLATGSPFA